MLPAIGSMRSLAGQGKFGMVVSAQPVGAVENDRQLVALKIRESNEGQGSRSPDASSPGRLADHPSNLSSTEKPSRGNSAAVASPAAARLPTDLTTAEKTDVTRLQQRDQQVRQEEKAHAAVAGDLAGPISYTFQRGPDGRAYAVGGSVGIQASSLSGDPAEAARKAGRLAAAANAATNPSLQDYAAAREAYALGSRLGAPSPREEETNGVSLTL